MKQIIVLFLFSCFSCNQTSSNLSIGELEVINITTDTLNVYYKALNEGRNMGDKVLPYRIDLKNNTNDTLYFLAKDSMVTYFKFGEYFLIKGDSFQQYIAELPDRPQMKFIPILPHKVGSFVVDFSVWDVNLLAVIFEYSKVDQCNKDDLLELELFFLVEKSKIAKQFYPPADFKDRVFYKPRE